MNALRVARLDQARREIQDCLIVGAGVNGATAAAALAGKGAKVTVIDKADFASSTSQESSNLAWGGIKYMENFEFGLVWKLCASRNELMRAYPNRVREIRFLTSVAKGFRKPLYLLHLGAWLYWLIGRCRTRPPRLWSLARLREKAPKVRAEGLAGAFEYSDAYFVDNDARFTFDFIQSALRNGSNAINYLELVSARWRDGHWECDLIDHVAGDSVSLVAKTLVNAAGPFADEVNEIARIQGRFRHVFSKGAHIIVPRISAVERVLTFFASDGRLFFMIPMGERTCVGTTDTRVESAAAEPSEDDVRFLLENANALLNLEPPLTPEDVLAKRCGVRPLAVPADSTVGDVEWTALSRKHEIDARPERNYCAIYGGKLTDCLNVGEEIAEIVASMGVALFQTLKPWYGESPARKRERFETECANVGLSSSRAERLWRRYGTAAFQCVEMIRRDPAMAEPVLGPFLRGELIHIAENEMVVRLEDFLRRRSRLALTEHPASLRCAIGLPEAARILFGARADEEIERYFDR